MGEMTDARDMLAFKARGMDARDKLNKIRNLKQGKLDEKTTQNGGITITTTTKGKVLLTTKRKELQKAKAKKDNKRPMAGMNAQPGTNCITIQSGAVYRSQGFEGNVLGSSSGWWAATVATYCPSRLVELPKTLPSKPCDR